MQGFYVNDFGEGCQFLEGQAKPRSEMSRSKVGEMKSARFDPFSALKLPNKYKSYERHAQSKCKSVPKALDLSWLFPVTAKHRTYL